MTMTEFFNVLRIKVNEKDVQDANRTLNAISNNAKKLLGAIGIGFSLTKLNALAEEFGAIGDRIEYAVGEAGNFEEAQQKILNSANACRAAMGSFTNEVTKLKQSNSTLFPIEDAASFVEHIHKLGKIAGQSDGEISNMQSQMQRIMSTGAASASDINRMLLQTPVLAEALAKGLGTDTESLSRMAAQGVLTAAEIKKAMVNAADDIDEKFRNTSYGIGDMMLYVRNKFGVLVAETDKMFEITQTIAKVGMKFGDMAISTMTKIRNNLVWIRDKLGGAQNLLKLIGITVGAIILYTRAGKIIDFLSKAGKGLRTIKMLLDATHLKMYAIIGLIILAALIVDDFINFMKGNNSVIGYAFEKAGIDADEMRAKIIHIWENLKQFFGSVGKFLKEVFGPVADWISEKFKALFGEDAFANLGTGLEAVINFLDLITTKLAESENAPKVLGAIAIAIGALIVLFGVVIPLVSGLLGLISGLAGVFSFLASPIGIIIGIILALIAVGYLLYKHWDEIKEWAAEKWESIKETIAEKVEAIKEGIREKWEAIKEKIAETWENIKKGASEKVENIKKTIVDGIQAAIDWITSLPEKAFQWGADIISGLIDGIASMIGGVGSILGGVWDWLTGGPKSTGDDLPTGRVQKPGRSGGGSGRGGRYSVQNLTDGATALSRGATPQRSTVNKSTTTNNVSRNVTQNNTFNNTFNGGTKDVQRQTSNAMRNSANDASAQLARGLAYAR